MAEPIRTAVCTQVDWWWRALFRRRLTGLTDAELWWEPGPGCWTLRAAPDGSFRYEWPPGSLGETIPPFTTMAWRLCHLTCSAMASWTMAMEGDPECQAKAMDLVFPPEAADALAMLDGWWTRWRSAVGALTDADLWTPLRDTHIGVDAPMMRLGAGDPLLHHLLHQHREFVHHGAEICTLRDLYRLVGNADHQP